MGRGRGKGKKLSITTHEDAVGGEDKKVLVQKRRGRPQKLLKDNLEEEVEKVDQEDDESDDNIKNGTSSEEEKNPNVTTEQGRKRKRNSQVKEKLESIEVENGAGNRSNTNELLSKSNGFRHNGSRRKSKPRRAAEAGVLCK